ncbi:hypothetical protein ACWD04_07480 [Streptomyces sp. NPDC002911]
MHRRFATGHDVRRMPYVSSPLLSRAVGPVVMIAFAALDFRFLRRADVGDQDGGCAFSAHGVLYG